MIVVGAGVAGLIAASELAEAGLSVIILEARERMGGRIYTLNDLEQQFPIELGAEFIHGRPPEILNVLQKNDISISEVDGDNFCVQNGKLSSCDFFSEVDEILHRMNDKEPDESFADFLQRCCPHASKETKEHALGYVAGFNAADPAQVSVHWLFRQMKAEEKIEGDRAFRPQGGYWSLLDLLQKRATKAGVRVRTNTVVQRIVWRAGSVSIDAVWGKQSVSLRASRVLVTVPLGVLQARPGEPGAIEFSPALPQEKLDSISGMEMGKVMRVVLHFKERFWDRIQPSASSNKTLSEMSFLFSQDEWFPTWWTSMPDRSPVITGWAPWQSAEKALFRWRARGYARYAIARRPIAREYRRVGALAGNCLFPRLAGRSLFPRCLQLREGRSRGCSRNLKPPGGGHIILCGRSLGHNRK